MVRKSPQTKTEGEWASVRSSWGEWTEERQRDRIERLRSRHREVSRAQEVISWASNSNSNPETHELKDLSSTPRWRRTEWDKV